GLLLVTFEMFGRNQECLNSSRTTTADPFPPLADGAAMTTGLTLATVLAVLVLADPPAGSDLATYQDLAAKAGRGAEAHVRLAIWCESHGLKAERDKHLALAVLTAPDHPLGRALLGQVK